MSGKTKYILEKENKNGSLLKRWKNREQKESLPSSTIEKAPADAVIPLSSGQQRLWFLQQLYPDNPFYNYTESFTFNGKLHSDSLKKALRRIFADYEVLRSFYPMENGQPILKVDRNPLDIRELDLSGLSKNEALSKADQAMVEQSTTRFDLTRPPLFKVSLLKLKANTHILFITMHHIITDIWSIDILKKVLASHYRKLCQGLELQIEKPKIQFADYAYWQRNRSIDTSQMRYWKDTLSGEIPLLNLHTDYRRPTQPAFNGKQYTQHFSTELSTAILNLAKKLETTPFVLLLAAYHVLLYRYTGQKDILIGSPISNRSTKSLESILGFFIDTVVLRNSLDGSQSFSGFVKSVRTNTLEAFSNKDIPFDILVKELKVDRSLTINPFFQVMFLYHTETLTPFFGDDVILSDDSEYDTGVAKFDLTLFIAENEGQLSSTFEYDTDLFDESTIARFYEHYQLLLQGIVSDPDSSIADIDMLTPKEKELFLEKSPSDSNAFSSYKAIHHIIEEVSTTYPNKIALTYGDTSMTYESLNRKATMLAGAICKGTEKKNETVGLCLERSTDMIVGMLAILKAGCAYLPIDPNYPSKRLQFVLEDSGANSIVTQTRLTDLFDGCDMNLLLVDRIEESPAATAVELPATEETDTAYVIYTSGSTGKPKGVPISHGNIMNSTAGRLAFYPKNPDAFLLMSSISFDSSKAGIYWTLCTGGNLVIAENRMEQDIGKLEDTVQQHSISHTLLLPSLYKLVLEHGSVSKLGSLNTVIVAGEACPPSLCDMHFDTLPNVDLYNEYGPTEATVWCIAHHIEKSDAIAGVPIGKAVADAQIYLLNENFDLVPYGAVGEIFIGGKGLAKGYIDRPELTHSSFIQNPFGKTPGEKLYRTGDLGRYRKDGAIEFLGRADHQVKIRGYRIELEEIEKALMNYGTVTNAVAMVETSAVDTDFLQRDDFSNSVEMLKRLKEQLTDSELEGLLASIVSLNTDQGNFSSNGTDTPKEETKIEKLMEGMMARLSVEERKLVIYKATQLLGEKSKSPKSVGAERLIAYVTMNGNFDTDDLKRSLRSKMPDYMIPSKIIEVDQFPLLPNGKIDKKVLRHIKGSDVRNTTSKLTKPNNEVEKRLVAIWQEVLDSAAIGVHDNFFEIGGDSILSIQVIAKAREAGMALSANQLFEHQTIAELALFSRTKTEAVISEETFSGLKHVVPIRSKGSKPPLFCLHSGGSHFFFYNPLANHIESDRPVYAIQASRHEGDLVLHQSVSEMAIEFIDEIKQIYPNGPYHFVSYCYNTAIGLEILQTLQRQSESANLIIADTMADYLSLFASSRTKTRALAVAERLRANPIKTVRGLVRGRIITPIRNKLKTIALRGSEKKIQKLHDNHIKIYSDYKWNPFEGTIQLLITEKNDPEFNSKVISSWEKIAKKGVNVVPVEGHHDRLFGASTVARTSASIDECMSLFETN